MEDYKKYIIPHNHTVTRENRQEKARTKASVLWFTGLSGSGKSTLASGFETYLHNQGLPTYILDGDNIRSGLNSDLDFSSEHRSENIRRIAEVAKLFVDAGVVVLTAFISPFEEDRAKARQIIGEADFMEIYVDCPLEVCEQRDVKGLYKQARAGKIKHFTGIDSPFEPPKAPDVVIDTASHSLEMCIENLKMNIESKLRT